MACACVERCERGERGERGGMRSGRGSASGRERVNGSPPFEFDLGRPSPFSVLSTVNVLNVAGERWRVRARRGEAIRGCEHGGQVGAWQGV